MERFVRADRRTMILHKIFIIEKLPDPVPHFEGLFISLVPEVSYQLSKNGVAYSIPEDFLPMQELYSEMPAYINLFDEIFIAG